MPTQIGREVVRAMSAGGAVVVEVLPADEYEDEHLPGAINIPLKKIDALAPGALAPDRPVIVYCYDPLWDLSPRAACRLESLGYDQVFDYVGGKRDWTGVGWPVEGKKAAEPRIGALARRDVPTALLGDQVGDTARRVEASGYDFAVVVTADDVVLGMLEPKALKASEGMRVEGVMRPGPSTYRPDVPTKELLEKLQPKGLHRALVATPEGRLIGVVLV